VLIEQAGAPLPAFPLIVVSGSLAASGQLPLVLIALVVLAACVLADLLWYTAGKRYGGRVLRLICWLSLTPGGCVAQTQSAFDRWGARSLIVAKFVPGLSTVATAMAGATQVPLRVFMFYDAMGSLLWASAGLAIGWVFAVAVEQVLTPSLDWGTGAWCCLVQLCCYTSGAGLATAIPTAMTDSFRACQFKS